MERMSWSAAEIKNDFQNCHHLKDLVEKIESDQSKKGRVICQIAVNGMSLDEMDEQRFAQSKVSEIKTLDIQYTLIRDLIIETEISTRDYAKSLVESIVCVSDLFRQKDINKAHIAFKELVTSMDSLIQANQLTINVRKNEGLNVSAELVDLDRRFLVLLNEILVSYEKSDFILVADVLEYEFTRALTDLSTILERILGTSTESKEGNPVV